MKKLLVIAGPTASGKTALSIAVAQRLNGEIVSADSMQIYRGMDIGTAKATPEERATVPHHMLDFLLPMENYSVSRYVEEASAVCEDILSRGKLPIVTGGTGLYIDALLAGQHFAGLSGEDGSLRETLNLDYDRLGGEEMLRRLAEADPARAEKLNPGDRRRIVRALEVFNLTGETISVHDARTREQAPAYHSLYTVLEFRDREKLYQRIEQRVDRMYQAGLLEEVRELEQLGLPKESTCLQAIGYRQALQVLRGELDRDEAVRNTKQATRRYAKRQLTWFRRHVEALRLYADELSPDEMVDRVCDAFERMKEDNTNDRS